ncbi:MAG TPA: HmuY family protein [Draconibacterium sp.]|nr:HmuY family protein [Draconibacterium sp.]
MRFLVTFIFLAFTLTSCFEEDTLVPPHESGDLTVGVVELTETYKYQVFFDFESNSTIKQNLISEWDLGFETSDSGWHVILNTSKMMLAGNTGKTDFENVKNSGGIDMNYDPSHGNLDSTAIGNWYTLTEEKPVSKGYVYIVDRGTDEDFNLVGEKKVAFNFENEDTYVVRFANLDGSGEQTMVIPKDTSVNFVCFSFEEGIVDIEPNKDSWDLQFGKYSTLLFTDVGDPYPYLVTGVLLNPNKTIAGLDSINQFDQINFEIAEQHSLVKQRDIIGYEWKEYDFDNEMYTVDPAKIYILKNRIGFYYKLRFIDYYNSTGERGFPTFEFLRL